MCIPHFNNAPKQYGRKEKKEPHKSIPFNKELMKPDPKFVDERKAPPPKKKSWFEELLG
ncbi:hypothetical protein [Sulfuricurvum sp.]|uniref:hypothetical protein n=1 Tax=Sulfuricurvum sp. TaxID=2025608 RepID=UPI0019880662|nr:hypothetical protein [Sulfuricurvum sp.]MBD3799291.1 hypothetical protein [Campylobacterota bacterium]MBD3806001.1 hypothetical protein [Sulfuricurvum sp.]